MADVSERRIRPILEAVETENWKQALQLCEKWHKKGEKSDRFQALRSYVLAKQQDASSAKRGRDEIVQLCNRTPAITDLDTIYQIQTALYDLGIEEDGGRRLWERAAAAKPEDRDIATTWLDEAINRCDWQSAQKATMALRKSSPKDRNHEFWNIFLCFLIHQDESVSDKERNLFGTLAYRMLSKAAEAVPQDEQELLSSGKAIQSPEELSLLVRVYLNTGHVQEAKEWLIDSKGLGPESALFKLDHDLHRSLQLEVLQAAEDWPTILTSLRMAVTEHSPENVQISRLLNVLLNACQKADSFSLLQKLQECLGDGLKAFPSSRDLRYDMLRLLQLQLAKDLCTAEDLLDACQQYFSTRCDQLSCSDELRESLEVLDAKYQQQVVRFAQETAKANLESKPSSLIPTLNTLKLEYCLIVSPEAAAQTLQDFISNVIDIYHRFCARENSSEPYAQLAMLACMALIRSSQTEQEPAIDRKLLHLCHLQAGFLLRYSMTKSRDDYPTLVVLTRICTLLGAISLSATFFKKLSIKNLQWENAGHLLLTRLSTLHPQEFKGNEEAVDPLQMLDLAMSANANSVRSVRRLLMVGLNNKSYVNVMESITFREDLKRSFSKQMYCIESARCQRLRDISNSEEDSMSSGQFVDRRDFSFMPSFEPPGSKPFSQSLEAGPKPKNGWLCIMKICSAIASLLDKSYHDPQSIQPTEIQEISSALADLPGPLQTAHDELTQTEIDNCNLQCNVGKILILRLQHSSSSPSTPTESNKATFDNAIQYIQGWLTTISKRRKETPFTSDVISMADSPIAPSWSYLHSAFSTLESLQLISLFLAAGEAKTSKTKAKSKSKLKDKEKEKGQDDAFRVDDERRKVMQDLIVKIEECIYDSARKLKGNLNASGVLGGMVDAVFGRGAEAASSSSGGDGATWTAAVAFGKELEKLPDAEAVAEGFCGEVKESWEDALDGVLAVRVRRWK